MNDLVKDNQMNGAVQIDMMVLSYAQTDDLKNVTINFVQSLLDSEDAAYIRFNIIVLESQKSLYPFQYQYTTTVYPEEEFNFHKYLSIGINMTSSPFIGICNNDLLFQKGWATEILEAFTVYQDVYSASPICPYYPKDWGVIPIKEVWFGHRTGKEVQGACLVFKRGLLKFIGQLDPNFKFYHADDDYAHTLQVLNLNHILVKSSIVYHIGSKTLGVQNEAVRQDLTNDQDAFYINKWRFRLGRNWQKI